MQIVSLFRSEGFQARVEVIADEELEEISSMWPAQKSAAENQPARLPA